MDLIKTKIVGIMINGKSGIYRGLLEWWSNVLCKFTPPKKSNKILEKWSK